MPDNITDLINQRIALRAQIHEMRDAIIAAKLVIEDLDVKIAAARKERVAAEALAFLQETL